MVGRVIGDYEIRREIGRGGMGTVYEAWQLSLQRPIALKVLTNTAAMTKTAVERFQREARAAAKLHHTNIVPIYAQGAHEGIYYYAMELVCGQSVYEIIQEMRGSTDDSRLAVTATRAGGSRQNGAGADESDTYEPSVPSATSSSAAEFGSSQQDSALSRTTVEHFDTIARLISTVADALEYAHQAGVIHRDIKPHNLILGDDGRLCVSDFGLARVLEQPGVTMTGEFLGSPLYMSPEQIRGGSAKADYRTDIYSLGATMYEWMTLRPPFPGESREQVISSIMTSDAPAPSLLNRNIPFDLETICLKAMEKDAGNRYQSAAAMAADLRRYLERGLIQARRAGPITRARKFVTRHPVELLTAVIVLIMAMFAGAAFRQRSQSQRKEAQLQATTSKLDEVEAAIPKREQQIQDLSQKTEELAEESEGLKNLVGALTQGQAEGARAGAGFVPQALGQGDSEEVDFGAQLGAVAKEAARQLPDALIAAQLLSVRRTIEATDPDIDPDSADSYYLQAAMATEDEPALELLDQALSRDADHFNARYLRAAVLCRLGRFGEMLQDGTRLTELRPDSPAALMLRGAGEMFVGKFGSAIQHLEQALSLGGESAWLHALRGLCYARLDDLVRGIQAYSKALELSPDHALSHFARGRAQYYLGVYTAALDDAEEYVRLVPDSVEGYLLRGECHDKLQQFDAAVADYNRAITLGDTSMTVVGKLAWAALNAREADAQADAAAQEEGAADVPAEPEEEEPSDEVVRPVHKDNVNWLDSWLKEKMRGNEPPPPASPDTAGYPFGAVLPGRR
ncbi:MAG TPA: protein kinase [Phycisphaerae bacterium]|nr:protein kinase [Phycisphaerae bacterium]